MLVREVEAERLDEVFLHDATDDAHEAVLDGGAQSFVVGNETLARYVEYLRLHGVDWKLKDVPCDKMFRFGNDETTHCTTATVIPVNFAGRTGLLQVHVLQGYTPFLFPRPLMERFGLVIDYGKKRLQWTATEWTKVKQRGSKGHYLLDLAEDLAALRRDLTKPSFVYAPDAPTHETTYEIGEATGTPTKTTPDPYSKELSASTCRALCFSVTNTKAEMSRMLRAAAKPLTRRRRCWEVYVGRGRVSEYLRQYGAEVEQFGLENGWDLTDPTHQAWFLRKMDDDSPDDIWMSPMCGPWSRVQELNSTTPEKKKALETTRKWHHEHVLMFVKKVFNKQVQAGRPSAPPWAPTRTSRACA